MLKLAMLMLLFALPGTAQAQDALRLDLILDDRSEVPFESEMVLATIRGVYRASIAHDELKLRQMADFDWMRNGGSRSFRGVPAGSRFCRLRMSCRFWTTAGNGKR